MNIQNGSISGLDRPVSRIFFGTAMAPVMTGEPGAEELMGVSEKTTIGTIISVDEKYAVVAFGALKTRVETSRLQRSNRKMERAQASSMSRQTTNDIRERQERIRLKAELKSKSQEAEKAGSGEDGAKTA